MDPPPKPTTSLFDVYLRLRPSFAHTAERFLDVEPAEGHAPTHITIRPPANDHRKRAVEKFAFTRVFEEDSAQLDLFRDAGLPEVIEGVLGQRGAQGRDGLLATLGVTGSGKVHNKHKDVKDEPKKLIEVLESHHSGYARTAWPDPTISRRTIPKY